MRLVVTMFLGCWAFTASAAERPIVVHSVIVSLIDDVNVASQQPGLMAKVHVREGDTVEAESLIAELDQADAQLELQRVNAELQIAKTQAGNRLKVLLAEKSLGVAAAELSRAEQSNDKFANTVSATELDKLRFSRDQAELQIEQARHEVELARMLATTRQTEYQIAELLLQRRRITAPLSGVVVQVDVQPGEWIQAGATVCRIIRTDRVRAEGLVKLSDGRVQPGQPVELALKIGDEPVQVFVGTLSFIDPEVNPITEMYRVWAEFENPDDRLRPGQRPQMTIVPLSPP